MQGLSKLLGPGSTDHSPPRPSCRPARPFPCKPRRSPAGGASLSLSSPRGRSQCQRPWSRAPGGPTNGRRGAWPALGLRAFITAGRSAPARERRCNRGFPGESCTGVWVPGFAAPPIPLRLRQPSAHGVLAFPSAPRPCGLGHCRAGRRAGPAPGRRASQVSQAPDEEAGGEAAPPQAQPATPLRVPGDSGQGDLREGEEGAGELRAPGECGALSGAGRRAPGSATPVGGGGWAGGPSPAWWGCLPSVFIVCVCARARALMVFSVHLSAHECRDSGRGPENPSNWSASDGFQSEAG